MSIVTEIAILTKKEFKLEWRQRFSLGGLLLYVIGTVVITYMSFYLKTGALNKAAWNSIFWIILLFIAVSATMKSFQQEGQQRNLYYYYVVRPESIILSKLIYNVLFMLALGLLTVGIFMIMLPPPLLVTDTGGPIGDELMFYSTLLLGCCGLAVSLTLVSAIASKAKGSSTLMAVLSFPIVIPMLVVLIRLCNNAIDGLDRSLVYNDIIVLGAIILIVTAISVILFPYLWRS